jgi:hypothetical protein
MKRFSAAVAIGALTIGIAGAAFAATATSTGTFTHSVGDIVQFITSDTTNATNATTINTWDVDKDNGVITGLGSTDTTDTVIIFRLVMNKNVTLTGSFANAAGTQNGALAQDLGSSTYEFLQTWANIASDGSGAVGSGDTTTPTAHETGRFWSGFASSVAADGTNAGLATGGGFNTNYNFAYIGGSASGSPDTPANAGVNTYTSSGTFLNSSGTTVTYVAKDGAARLRVTVRAFNGEDFGDASNSTEAPDPGSFATTLTLTATY